MWWNSACDTCKYHETDIDDWTQKKIEYCEKGKSGLQGFPFKKQPKCYVASEWKCGDKQYWEEYEG